MGCCSSGGCKGCQVGFILVMVGALNWGLVGLGGFLGRDLNVVHMVLGTWPAVESVVYLLVGLAALAKILNLCKCCKKPA
ncbi:hypothetical protein A3C37_01175 [Candidatus Peribacteria bacterium RIFCSPHIGHO2_02_FULL_53_20]|nr:MAG: hypothetical protein A3C37_01175 [Candidatus Peribacteria bacterium RIFCSPHIGHO2_02_FULL_53_20]OGJ68282.1 MAG: hypothetical protein A3B61_01595 [Candidatus Peribacteria bacterium RIFCSPLOWO2_01_FULL_53_10]OGJ73624.1 MAG: hypothetical protein A3G69_00525 [Candidatus Peribacteria bacterium RIFCSPLOWO2_12_FULL_53_10]